MNIVAHGFGLRKGDTVLTTDVEHNSNHVQWLQMAEDVGIRRRYCKTSQSGEFDIEEFKKVISSDVHLGHILGEAYCAIDKVVECCIDELVVVEFVEFGYHRQLLCIG